MSTPSEVDNGSAVNSTDLSMLQHHLVQIMRIVRVRGGGLTAGVYSALWTVSHHGPLRMSALAERESVSVPVMSRMVATLEKKGYVGRTTDPQDRRAVLLTATDAGDRLLRHNSSQKAQLIASAVSRMDPRSAKALHESLAAFSDALGEVARETAPSGRPPPTDG